MKEQLIRLYSGDQFSREEAKLLLKEITSGQFPVEQVSAFLMGLNMRDLVVDELIGFREAMLEQAIPLDLSPYETIDIVGTGGDGKNTFNISTLTSFIVAGAGYKVAKHGSYAVSSISGSADVLLKLGVRFTADQSILSQAIEEANIAFLHAPLFHPAMKEVVPIRRALGIKTIFNILGPLINPSHSSYAVLGVYSEQLAPIYAQVLSASTMKNYSIVHGLDGYDEISLTSNTLIKNEIGERVVTPEDFLYQKINPSSIFGGSSKEEAAEIFRSILNNESNEEAKQVVLANAAVAIQTIDDEKSLEEAKLEAQESLESGAARQSLDRLVAITNKN